MHCREELPKSVAYNDAVSGYYVSHVTDSSTGILCTTMRIAEITMAAVQGGSYIVRLTSDVLTGSGISAAQMPLKGINVAFVWLKISRMRSP